MAEAPKPGTPSDYPPKNDGYSEISEPHLIPPGEWGMSINADKEITPAERQKHLGELVTELHATGKADFDQRVASADPKDFLVHIKDYQPKPRPIIEDLLPIPELDSKSAAKPEDVFSMEALATHEHDENLKKPMSLAEAQEFARQTVPLAVPKLGEQNPEALPETGDTSFIESQRKLEEAENNIKRNNGDEERRRILAEESAMTPEERVLRTAARYGQVPPTAINAAMGKEGRESDRFTKIWNWTKERGVELGAKLKEAGIELKDDTWWLVTHPGEALKKTLSGVDRGGRYIADLLDATQRLDDRLARVQVDTISMIEGYNKLSLAKKFEITAALIGVTAVTGIAAAPTIASIFAKGAFFGQRGMAALGFGANRAKDALVADTHNVIKYGYAGLTAVVYGTTTLLVGRAISDGISGALREGLGHLMGHGTSVSDQASIRLETKFTPPPSAVAGAAASVGSAEHHMDWSYAKPGGDGFPFGVSDTVPPVTPEASIAVTGIHHGPTIDDLRPDNTPAVGAEHAASATAAPHEAVHHAAHHVAHHPEGISLAERDALETKALNELQLAHPGVVSTPEEITAKMNELLAEHAKHVAHVEMLNAHRANLGLAPHPKPELAPAQPTAAESVQAPVQPAPAAAPVAPSVEHAVPAPAESAAPDLSHVGAQDQAYHAGNAAPVVEAPHPTEAAPAPEPTPESVPNTGGVIQPEHSVPGTESAPSATISPSPEAGSLSVSHEAVSGLDFAATHPTEAHLYSDTDGKHLTLWGGTPQQQTDFLTQHAAEHPNTTVDGTDASGKWMVRYPIDKNGNVGTPIPVRDNGFLGFFQSLKLAPDPKNLKEAFKSLIQ